MNARTRINLALLVGALCVSCGDGLWSPDAGADAALVASDGPRFDFETGPLPACETPRVKIVAAYPGEIAVGQSARIEAALLTFPGTDGGTPQLSWWLQRAGAASPTATLEVRGACGAGAAACATVTCTDAPSAFEAGDAALSDTEIQVMVRYDDGSCFDASRIFVPCRPVSQRDAGS